MEIYNQFLSFPKFLKFYFNSNWLLHDSRNHNEVWGDAKKETVIYLLGDEQSILFLTGKLIGALLQLSKMLQNKCLCLSVYVHTITRIYRRMWLMLFHLYYISV